MKSLAEFIPFIKREISVHESKVQRLVKSDPRSAEKHRKIAAEFRELLENVERPTAATTDDIDQLSALRQSPTALTQAMLVGLPMELLDQLQISEADKFNWAVEDFIDSTPGKVVSIEILLIGLFRTTGKIYDRTDLTNRLYRLGKKDGVYSVPGKKGHYTTTKPADETNQENESQDNQDA